MFIFLYTADPTEAMRAVAELASEPFVAGSLENFHIVEHTAGHMTLKKLISNDIQRMKNGETGKMLTPQSLYFKTTHETQKMWSYIASGLNIKLC